MRLFLTAAALAFTATSAFAAPAENHMFSRDGFTYNYAQSLAADGTILLNGHVKQSGEDFALRVAANGHVSGTIGVNDVDFVASKATMAAIAEPAETKIAAN